MPTFIRPAHDESIQLGQLVRDTISGFEGKVTSRIEYLNGCVRYGVQPPVDKDGKMPAGEFIDWQQLEVLVDDTVTALPARAGGGPQRDTPSAR